MIQVSKLIVWCLNPKSETMNYLKKLLKSIDTYYHPSNEGSWTGLLGDFLLILCTRYSKRIKKETLQNNIRLNVNLLN
jgi:proteasome activator subunit 4